MPWDVDTLKELVEARIETLSGAITAVERRATAALEASEKAIDKAEHASNARFASVNEFRQTLTDQAGRFVSREEIAAQMAALAKDIGVNASRVDRIEARGLGLNAGWVSDRRYRYCDCRHRAAAALVLLAAARFVLVNSRIFGNYIARLAIDLSFH